MDLGAFISTETWLTDNVSDQKCVNLAGYSFHYAGRMHKKSGGVGILLHDSLKCESHLRFQARSLPTEYFIWSNKCSCSYYDIMVPIDQGKSVLFVLLNLSAAFDTVDHKSFDPI